MIRILALILLIVTFFSGLTLGAGLVLQGITPMFERGCYVWFGCCFACYLCCSGHFYDDVF